MKDYNTMNKVNCFSIWYIIFMVAGSAPAALKAAGNTIKPDIYDKSKNFPNIYYEDH